MQLILTVSLTLFALGSCLEIRQRKCGCPFIDEPVCGTTPDGKRKDFDNSCRAGCEDAVDITPGKCEDATSGDEPPIRLCGCPPIHDPVCAINSKGLRVDFSNRCEAGCADATDIQPGECSKRPPVCFCPLLLSPVCATLPDGSRDNFPNSCEAKCKGATDIEAGECGQQPPTPTCVCPKILMPVCGRLSDGTLKDFSNYCVARCHHATDVKPGDCGHTPPLCACPKILLPVCGRLADGTRQDFANECLARCAKVTRIHPGACCHDEEPSTLPPLCGCQPLDEPVCAIAANGALEDFPNKCEAVCAKATDIQEGTCDEQDEPDPPRCVCPMLLAPVCGTGRFGLRKDFPNQCMATCHAATDITPGKCDGSSILPPLCGCQPVDEPVCARRSDGTLADFINPCEASCAKATDAKPGKCSEEHPPQPPIRLCGCPPIIDPVCGQLADGSHKDFDNKCEAGCADATHIQRGKCCSCPEIFSPVCGKRADGSERDYDNDCQAKCEDAVDIREGHCYENRPVVCTCPKIRAPVCGNLPDGTEMEFVNDCQAKCLKATDVRQGKCDDSDDVPMRLCGCPPIHDPVCGKLADGTFQNFSNKCQAGCADARVVQEGRCEHGEKGEKGESGKGSDEDEEEGEGGRLFGEDDDSHE